MKKLTSLLFIIFLSAALLVSCGGGDEGGAENPPTPEHIHAFGEWETSEYATCTADGKRVRACECGEIEQETLPTVEHGWEYIDHPDVVQCEYMGCYDLLTQECSVCHEQIVKPGAGHIESEWVIDAQPSCTAEGKQHKYCLRGYNVLAEEAIPMLKHEYVDGFCFMCGAIDPEYCSEGLEYTLSDDGSYYILSGIGTCTDTTIIVPYLHNDLPVKEIGESAFEYCEFIVEVIVGDAVVLINDYAFDSCTSLTSVTIGSGVETIGSCAFEWCESLTNVTIPSSVMSISDDAFYDCSMLRYNEYDNGYYLGNDDNPYHALIVAKDEAITSCIINSNTRVISNAFGKCEYLTEIAIPSGVTTIAPYTFAFCKRLERVVIPDSVVSIEQDAFHHCYALKDVVIPDSVKTIGESAFSSCYALEEIVIVDGIVSIEDYVFSACKNLESIVIPDSVTSIGEAAFWACNALADIYYAGSEDEWNLIVVDKENEALGSVTIHFDYTGER